MEICGYKAMWVMALFDLPTQTKREKKAYARFRKALLNDGFAMLQYSVYARHCASEENTQVHINRVRNSLPEQGEVRIIAVTDKQFERMNIFRGKKHVPTTPAPAQLEMF